MHAIAFVLLCKAVPRSHEHPKTGMAWDCSYSTYESCSKTIHEHIAYVLPKGESKGDEYSVDNPVELEVELRVLPCTLLHEKVLEALLRHRNHNEIQKEVVENRSFLYEARKHELPYPLGQHCKDGGYDSLYHEVPQKSWRLLVQMIDLVHLHKKHDSWNHGSCNEYWIEVEEIEERKKHLQTLPNTYSGQETAANEIIYLIYQRIY